MPPRRTVNEFELIEMLEDAFLRPIAGVDTGIGDDCAVLRWKPGVGNRQLVTTDTMVEGTHFDLSYTRLWDVGWKAVAVNVSDIYAMAGYPRYALATVGFPPKASPKQAAELTAGILDCLAEYNLPLIGGDTFAAPQWQAGLTLIGESDGAPILRRGAKPGDLIWHTGWLASSQVGFHVLWGRKTKSSGLIRFQWMNHAVDAHRSPRPSPSRRDLLKAASATSAIDLSDSVAQSLLHLAAASGVGLRVDLSDPRHGSVELDEFSRACRRFAGQDESAAEFTIPGELDPSGKPQTFASLADFILASSEEYGLIFTTSPETAGELAARYSISCKLMGEVTPVNEGCRYLDQTGVWQQLRPVGWKHG